MAEHPATLLWIGPTRHPEFVDAFRYCRRHVGQLAVRSNLAGALARPAGHVARVLFARPIRTVPSSRAWAAFQQRYLATGDCRVLALTGSLCDGESRSGDPWPGGEKARFSRWAEVLPAWLGPCLAEACRGLRTAGSRAAGSRAAESTDAVSILPRGLLVLCDRYSTAEPLLQLGLSSGLPVAWQRQFLPALHAGFDRVLWDDSIAGPTNAAEWRERLRATETPLPAGLRRTHLWMALQPSASDLREALAGGISEVLTKPILIDRVLPPLVADQVAGASAGVVSIGRAASSMKSVR